MNDEDTRVHQTSVRSREFMAQCIDDFAEGGAARQLYAELQAGITRFEQMSAAYGAGLSEARQGTQRRSETRAALVANLDLIRSAARVMGVAEQFPKPEKDNDDSLLQTADIYAAHALLLKAQFIAHELPADFLEDLAADKAAFQSAIADQGNAKGDHIAARQELDDARDNLVATLRGLTGVIKIRYVNNSGKLAEWTAASHIERPSKRPKKAEPPPPASPPQS
jgi:hypothetical protein